jgi:hypothetical protein
VDNYSCASEAQAAFVWDTICSDVAAGKVVELSARPRWVHPLYVNETENPPKCGSLATSACLSGTLLTSRRTRANSG